MNKFSNIIIFLINITNKINMSLSNLQPLIQQLITKSLIAKQQVEYNNSIIGGVNQKGELMVGDGTNPNHLDPSTGVDGDVLTKDDTTTIGVKWDGPPSQGSNNGLLHLTSSTVLLNDNHNHIVTCVGTFNVVLPETPPIGTRFDIVNLCDNIADVTTLQAGAGSMLVDRLGNSYASYPIDVDNRAFVYRVSSSVWKIHGL
jgi:hypothetical protein